MEFLADRNHKLGAYAFIILSKAVCKYLKGFQLGSGVAEDEQDKVGRAVLKI